MDAKTLETLAKQQAALPAGLNLTEQHYFISLRSLCCDCFNGKISREQLITEQQQLRTEFDRDEQDRKRTFAMYCQYQHNIKQADELVCKLAKAYNAGESDREMLKIAVLCVAALTGDKALENHFYKLLEEPKCT